jgi:hypothetical protein
MPRFTRPHLFPYEIEASFPSALQPMMRRIPRPQRSIDQRIPSSHIFRPRPCRSPCRAAFTSAPLLRTTSAPFSSSARDNGILDGKQDKKKHQAFVRRWQKRLLGDSEPIGAHVDPYDATSPVRISPEETGEEQEILDDAKLDEHGQVIEYGYEEAESGEGLERVGGKRWNQLREEELLRDRYVKLLQRPYPLDRIAHNYTFQRTDWNGSPKYKYVDFTSWLGWVLTIVALAQKYQLQGSQ